MKIASDPKDVQDFLFKQSSTRQVFNGFKTVPAACSLVASDGKRGLLYVGHQNKVTVLRCSGQTVDEWKFEHELPQTISRVSMSCDYEYLSITFHKSTARIYNASSLTRNNLELLHEIQLSSTSDDVFAYDLKWNPAISGMFCTVASDHTIGSFMVKTDRKTTVGLVALERIEGHEVLCVAWSPKGKQIVVGCKNGNIVQLKPDLKVARTIPGPTPSVGGVIAILWLSNYQFCATYQDLNDRSIKVLIVDAPKGETKGIFTCYDDITYGMPETEAANTLSRYYLDHVAEWGLIVAASSSSTEVAVLGSHDNGNTWEQWQLVDSGRAQLPLIRTTESYPVGLTIDRSSDTKLALGPETTLPQPVPVLHIFGTSGQLISFHMVYLSPNCPSLCTPPTEVITAVQTVPVPRPSLVPSEISFNLNTGATSTPRPKQAEVPIERPKILPSANLFNDSTKPPPAPAQQVQQVELKVPRPRVEKIEPAPVKIEQRLSPVKEVPSHPEPTPVDESLCLRAYFEEQILFEKELNAKLEPQTWKCGTEEEQRKLVTQSAIIDEFLRELRETTNSLSSDVDALKALLLQSFAWLEETKSKNSANSTSKPRDRGDRTKIRELQKCFFNIQSQLIQATKALDIEWVEHESRGRSKIEIPRLEFIYQSLKSHSEIIAKEKSILEQQSRKWKALARGNKTSGLNRSMSKLNISSTVATTTKNSDGGAVDSRCKAIANNARNFSQEKQMKLRDLLLSTTPRVIKAITPSPVQDRLEVTLSSLALVNSVQNPSKSKPETVSAVRAVSNNQTAPKSIPQPSPLASLNSIVAKFVPASTNEFVVESKPQSKPFTASNTTTTTLFGANTSQVDKKPTGTPIQQVKPKQSITVTLNPPGFASQMPSNPRTHAFSDVQSISFGTPESKPQEPSAPTTSGDLFSKGIKPHTSKDNFAVGGSTFFQDAPSKPLAPLSSGLTITRNEPQNTTSSVGLKSNFPGIPEGTTIQEILREPASTTFNLASSGQPAMGTKNAGTDSVPITSSLQTFSFASKPMDDPNLSFALKDSTTTAQPPAQAYFAGSKPVVPGLFDLNLASIGGNQSFGKFTVPASTPNFGEASSAAASSTASSPPATSAPALRSEPLSTNIFSNAAANSPATSTSFDKIPSNNSSGTSIFGGSSATSAAPTNLFGGGTSALTSSLFGGLSMGERPSLSSFNVGQTTSTTSNSATLAPSSPPSIFGTAGSTATPTLAKPDTEASSATSFGKLPINLSSPTFGGLQGSSSSTVNFGTSAAVTASPPAYGKAPEAPAAASIFSQTPVVSSASPSLAKAPTTTAATNLFGRPAVASPTGGSVFGNAPSAPSTTIFGGGTASPIAPSVFETNSAPIAPFGSPATIFGGSVLKSPSSVFGGGTASPVSAFGGGATQAASPIGPGSPQAATAFGQAPAFGAKPVFGGQTSVFGAAKPEFSNPFGGSTFGASAVPSGFSVLPAMGGSPPPLGTAGMQKVFGNPAGTSTFESLAGQNGGHTFGGLAQETPEPPKAPAFSSWR